MRFGLRFKSAALSHGLARHNGSLLNLGGLSTVTAKLLWRDLTAGHFKRCARQKRIVHMLDPSDTVVFSGARTCGIVVPLIKDREIRLESRK